MHLAFLLSLLSLTQAFAVQNNSQPVADPASTIRIALILPYDRWFEWVFNGNAETMLIYAEYLSKVTDCFRMSLSSLI